MCYDWERSFPLTVVLEVGSPEEVRNLVGEGSLVKGRIVVEVDNRYGFHRTADPGRTTSPGAFQQLRTTAGGECPTFVRRLTEGCEEMVDHRRWRGTLLSSET